MLLGSRKSPYKGLAWGLLFRIRPLLEPSTLSFEAQHAIATAVRLRTIIILTIITIIFLFRPGRSGSSSSSAVPSSWSRRDKAKGAPLFGALAGICFFKLNMTLLLNPWGRKKEAIFQACPDLLIVHPPFK